MDAASGALPSPILQTLTMSAALVRVPPSAGLDIAILPSFPPERLPLGLAGSKQFWHEHLAAAPGLPDLHRRACAMRLNSAGPQTRRRRPEMKVTVLATAFLLTMLALAPAAGAAACGAGPYRAGCVGPNEAVVAKRPYPAYSPPPAGVACARGDCRAGCVGPNGAAVDRARKRRRRAAANRPGRGALPRRPRSGRRSLPGRVRPRTRRRRRPAQAPAWSGERRWPTL